MVWMLSMARHWSCRALVTPLAGKCSVAWAVSWQGVTLLCPSPALGSCLCPGTHRPRAAPGAPGRCLVAFPSWSLDPARPCGRAGLQNCRALPGSSRANPQCVQPQGHPGPCRAPGVGGRSLGHLRAEICTFLAGAGRPQLQPHSSTIMSSWCRATTSPRS